MTPNTVCVEEEQQREGKHREAETKQAVVPSSQPLLRSRRQEDYPEFQASLSYTVRPCLTAKMSESRKGERQQEKWGPRTGCHGEAVKTLRGIGHSVETEEGKWIVYQEVLPPLAPRGHPGG